jgi:hypothetical protein
MLNAARSGKCMKRRELEMALRAAELCLSNLVGMADDRERSVRYY